jgi:hypothetical protein
MEKDVPMPDEKPFRNGNLTAALLLIWITNIALIALFLHTANDKRHPHLWDTSTFILNAICGLNIFFTFGVWFWKRWGLYGLGVVGLFLFAFGFSIPLFEFGLLLFLIRPYWAKMT